ncbi:polyisoprenoid-binding protein [Rhizobium sp. CG5]|nr:polyisoprenoid-binding protein [Rhizobium sp. CG5]
MKKTICAALLAAAAFTANAQDISVKDMGQPDPSRLSAGTYTLDTHHSHVAYDVDNFGISHYLGLVGGLSGKLDIDPRNPAAAMVDIEIPVDGILSTSAALDAHLKTEDFFDSEKHPVATFKSKSVAVSGTDAVISGALTLHGVTRDIKLQTRLVGIATHPMSQMLTVGFEATARIKRSEFGISYLVPFISDAVELRISAVFEKDA